MLRWFDRRFTFDYPSELAGSIIERLRGTPVRLESRLDGLSRDVLLRSDPLAHDQSETRGGGWSIQEHVGHLLDLEPLWVGRLDDFEAGAERLRPADLTNARTHEAHHNESSLGALLDAFQVARAEHVARLEALEAEVFAREALHPRLEQSMRLVDSCCFVAEHDDHHLAVITRLLSGEPSA